MAETIKTKRSDFLKLIAALTMLIDHTARLIEIDYPALFIVMRLIGRLSLPIYAYYLARGFACTRSLPKYALRLAVFAIISQVPYGLFFNDFLYLNIMFTFLLSLLALYAFTQKWYFTVAGVALVPVCTQILFGLTVDYSFYGVLLPVLFYYFDDNKKYAVLSIAALSLMYCLATGDILQARTYLQMAALLALPLIFFMRDKIRLTVHKYFFYIFYPLHLWLLYFAVLLLR